uniref:(northern house mosquito) hypothetical protein n=1 Tax=Culex pipiens TaxID=7175 RepID=A0A8D8AQF8_CULPI
MCPLSAPPPFRIGDLWGFGGGGGGMLLAGTGDSMANEGNRRTGKMFYLYITTAPKIQNAETINTNTFQTTTISVINSKKKPANISLLLSLGKYHSRLGIFADNSLIVCALPKRAVT